MPGRPLVRLVLVAAVALVGVAAVALGQAGVLRADVDERGATVMRVDLPGRGIEGSVPMSVVVPRGGGSGRGLVVLAHGRGGDESSELRDALFAGLARLGDRAPVVALPAGGSSSYWHDRDTGAWGRVVTAEAIPAALRASGADRRRVAVGGISMGGFGAYDLARRHPGRFCAVGGHSPALWTSAGATAPGAFDDAADFARHDVVAAARRGTVGYRDVPLWLDAGTGDPFEARDRAMVAALRARGADLEVRRWPGGHDRAYWDRHMGAYLAFYARELAGCER